MKNKVYCISNQGCDSHPYEVPIYLQTSGKTTKLTYRCHFIALYAITIISMLVGFAAIGITLAKSTSSLKGSDGSAGPQGPIGPTGPQGPRGETGQTEKITEARLQSAIQSLSTAQKTECPNYGMAGLKRIFPKPYETSGIDVFCDTYTDGGRWIVLQRREDGSENFYRDWNDYVHGFGSKHGEFWIGLEVMHQLTQSANYELYIDLMDFEGQRYWAKYSTFMLGAAASKYQLTAHGYSGNAGDGLAWQNGMKFSTKDSDNDAANNGHCAQNYSAAWWYNACLESNLNGQYIEGGVIDVNGVGWQHAKNNQHYSFKFAEMKIRKIKQ